MINSGILASYAVANRFVSLDKNGEIKDIDNFEQKEKETLGEEYRQEIRERMIRALKLSDEYK